MTTNQAFEGLNGIGDELGYVPEPESICAHVWGVGSLYRIILETLEASASRYTVTMISGPGSEALVEASTIVHVTKDTTELDWLDAIWYVARETAKQIAAESRPDVVVVTTERDVDEICAMLEPPMDPTGIDCAERYDGIDF